MALNHRIRIYEQSCVIFLKVLFDNSYFCKKLIMNIKERQRKIMTAGAEKITKWIGSTKSVILHTLFFVISFLLPNIGWVEFDRMLLILTTVVSLEAIYLSIFIQISLNLNSESIEIIQEDIQEIGEDLEELSDDIEELSEDIEEIGDDITKKTDRELLISIQKSMVLLKREITILKKSNPKS